MRDDLKVLILLIILTLLLGSILYYIKSHEHSDEDLSASETSYYGDEFGEEEISDKTTDEDIINDEIEEAEKEEKYSNETVDDASPYPESTENYTVEPIVTYNSAEESEQ